MSKKQLDLTNGPIGRTLAKLALPIMASSFLTTAYNITDMAWIGMLGSKAVAGVGVGGMYVWLSGGLVSLARMGGQVNVAQSCGRNDRKAAGQYAAGAIQISILFGVLFGLICFFLTDGLVGFFKLGDAETIVFADRYMKITCGLILFSFLNLTMTGVFTAHGDSKTPFRANLAGLVLNMLLDPVLILGIGPFPRMEVIGAATATVLSQIVVMLVMVRHMAKKEQAELLFGGQKLYRPIEAKRYKTIFRIGFPTALQGSVYCMISMVLTRLVAHYGAGAVATQRVGGQIESVSWNTADGFASALNAFVGQNFGAGKRERIRKGYRVSFIILAVWGLLMSAVFILWPRAVAVVFFNEEAVIREMTGYLQVIGVSQSFMCIEILTIGALSGLGKTQLCSVISIIVTGARIPLAYLLTGIGMGVMGVWWALTLTSMAKGMIFALVFRHVTSEDRFHAEAF